MLSKREVNSGVRSYIAENVKTLDYKSEYMLQSWAYVNTWYLFAPLQRILLRFQKSYIKRMNVKAFSHIPQVSSKDEENIGFQEK